MRTLREWIKRVLGTLRPDPTDADLQDELRLHLDLAAADARRWADSPANAVRAARIRAGGITQTMDALRDQRGLPWLTDLKADVRYGWRMLIKNPGFTTVAVLTLAVGIGANTAVFSIVDTLLWRPPPFEHADRLYWIYDVNDTIGVTVNAAMYPSPGNFVDWRSQNRSFDYMVAWQNWFFSVAGPDGYNVVAEQVRGVRVSPSFFAMLGVKAARGRTFQPDEEQPGHDRVVVLTDVLWKRRFGADPSVVGKTILVDGRPFSIIGVLPSDFYFLQPDFDMWMPLTIDGDVRSARSSHSIEVLARLAPGVALADAQSDLDRIAQDLQRTYSATNAGWSARLRSVFPFNRDLRPTLRLLSAAVGCVLLIVCVNVANLLLVQVGARQREIAIRAAVGASRGRVIRQLLTESVLLTGLGTAAGWLLARWSLGAVRPLIPPVQMAGPMGLALDARVFLFALCAASVTTVAFGVLPAVQASRTEFLRLSAPSRRTIVGRALLVTEIAASLMLLIGATLLIRSLWNLERVNPGFRPERLVTMQVWLPKTKYPSTPSVSGFFHEALRRLAQFPEVRAAAFVNTRPFLGWSLGATIDIPGRVFGTNTGNPIVGCRVISPGYLAALDTPLVRGRAFADSDGTNSVPVVLINEAMARRFWPTEEAIGKTIHVRSLGSTANAPWWPEQATDTFTIVGIVGNVQEGRLSERVEPVVYLSYLQNPSRYMHLLLRSESAAATISALAQREIQRMDPDLGVYDVQTMEAVVGQAVAQPRLVSLLLWVFATVALLLSAVGVYGVTSCAVGQRTREFAIRMAVGATPGSVFRLVTRETIVPALAGMLIGLGGALLMGRTLASLLYGVVPTDPTTLVVSAGVVVVVALLACWRPAWRATRVDPMDVLRTE